MSDPQHVGAPVTGAAQEAGHDPGVSGSLEGAGGMEFGKTESEGTVRLKVFRGTGPTGLYQDFELERQPGMVVLDCIHKIQEEQATDLACRWNCKAGKCGSCSAEINGHPRLMCMTRLEDIKEEGPIHVAPLKAFPVLRDLVPDVAWNYRQNEKIQPFTPRQMDAEETARGQFRMHQEDVDRVQEFRKCIECFLCQDVCHVLRNHGKHDAFVGPRFLIRYAGLEMHPADEGDRVKHAKDEGGIGFCNITKCCTEVCPEHITITDNAIIPMKERVVDEHYDPLLWLVRKLKGGKKRRK